MNKFQKAYYVVFFFIASLMSILAFFFIEAPENLWARLARLLLTLILFNGFIYMSYKVHEKIAQLYKNNKI